uniref:ADAM 17-like protease (Trinotate prediction) n=1 Tax=Henneguya salminicola TaxID=69463 RepID=A0A6G3MG97_HENSL
MSNDMKEPILIYNIKQANRFGKWHFLDKYKYDPYILLDKSREYSRSLNTCTTGIYVSNDWNGILGYAYIGTADGEGICNQKANFVVTNTVFGEKVFHKAHKLTTLHEIGHNLGAEHDLTHDCNKTRFIECSPSDQYIMSYRSNTGNTKNNNLFSPFSVDMIKKMLKLTKRRNCLKRRNIFYFKLFSMF